MIKQIMDAFANSDVSFPNDFIVPNPNPKTDLKIRQTNGANIPQMQWTQTLNPSLVQLIDGQTIVRYNQAFNN